MKNKEYYLNVLLSLALFWLFFSFFGSFVKIDTNNCGRKFNFDYFFYTDLFCEVE